MQRQHFPTGARAEGDAISTRCGLQRPEHTDLVRIGVVVGHVGLTLLFDEHPLAGAQLHHAGDDLVQHRLQRLVTSSRQRRSLMGPMSDDKVAILNGSKVH